jgi:fructose-bisphosphate aldolase class I
MTSTTLAGTAQALVAEGKGILAADETVETVTRRLAALDIDSTAESRRMYREMFFTTAGIGAFVSGVILQDETVRQRNSKGMPLPQVLSRQGIIPGIKVDNGAKPLAGWPSETVTEGLDGLGERLEEYRKLGARFAKWRAVFTVSDTLPSVTCVYANTHALARYAAVCQQHGLVPIVEPEVLMNGTHTIERCEEVTGNVLHSVFAELFEQHISLEGMLLKPNMVIAGDNCAKQALVKEVALSTLRCLSRHVPCAVPGIVFLSGGQGHLLATMHLSVLNQIEGEKPWKLSFSYGRALQQEALETWCGRQERFEAGQQAFSHRARCSSAAALGTYTPAMESERVAVE